MYVSKSKWDETPMNVTNQHLLQVATRQAGSEVLLAGDGDAPVDVQPVAQIPEKLPFKATAILKMFASEHKYVMLFSLPIGNRPWR